MKNQPESPIPVFVILELLVRMQEISQNIGDYQTHYFAGEKAVVQTTEYRMEFSFDMLFRQYFNPSLITREELQMLISKLN